jgi:hypothetical protein
VQIRRWFFCASLSGEIVATTAAAPEVVAAGAADVPAAVAAVVALVDGRLVAMAVDWVAPAAEVALPVDAGALVAAAVLCCVGDISVRPAAGAWVAGA